MTERSRAWAPLVASLLILSLRSASASAAAHAVEARVVWSHEDRVYVAARDSGAFDVGWLATFMHRNRPIAAGEVAGVVNGEIAVVRLTSGSLDGVKHLDRLRVLTEAPPPRIRSRLRIGAPSGRRANLVVECGVVVAPPVPGGYAGDIAPDRSTRFVRLPEVDCGQWPETLTVRLFDDATDEEIAFERGELDVAVFWPGEASEHLRQTPHGREALFGRRSRGVVTGAWLDSLGSRSPDRGVPDRGPGPSGPTPTPGSAWSMAELPELASMNEQLFRGDLAPLRSVAPAAATTVAPDSNHAPPIVYRVDPSLPGHRALQKFLDRGPVRSGRPRALALAYADEPLAPLDSIGATSERHPLFALRCPVVCAAGLRPYVETLGADAIVDLLVCAPR